MDIKFIARTCHEVNRTFCQALGDYTQSTWDFAPDWQKESAINGVQFHLDNPDATPEASHENWLKEKQRDLWVYGPVKNAEMKTHPCCVPYKDLPKEQQAKDTIFMAVITALS